MVTYVYGLYDPRISPIEWRYVGKTIHPDDRLNFHVCKKALSRKSYTSNWIKSLLKDGVRPVMKILQRIPDGYHETWQEAERKWIMIFRLMGYSLTNCSDGGEGCSGFHHTLEARRKIGDSLRGRKLGSDRVERSAAAQRGKKKPGVSRALKGKKRGPHSIKRRENISRALMGHSVSDETRKNISVALKGRKNPKVSRALKGRKQSVERRRNTSRALMGHFVSEETRCKIGRAMSEREVKKETRCKMALNASKQWKGVPKTPIQKARMSLSKQARNGLRWVDVFGL